MTTPIILLINDEPLIRLYLGRVLLRTCPTAAVLLAASVREARHVLAANLITAILSDDYLGDSTALNVLQLARSPVLHCPVIVTATDTMIAAAVLAAGTTAFVSKLAAVPDLQRALAVWC